MRRQDSTQHGTQDPTEPARIFYDGACGFCHWTVRFVVERDRDQAFRFAPIGGQTFESELTRLRPDCDREKPSDSVHLLLPSGKLLVRSDAAIYILARLPGPWPKLGKALGWLPRAIRDAGYRLVASLRRTLFARPTTTCPLLPPEQQSLFDP